MTCQGLFTKLTIGMKFKYLLLFPLLSSLGFSVNMQKPYFESLIINDLSLVKAVDRINRIHSSQSGGKCEFKILLDDPLNMNESVTLALNDVNLDLLMGILLSGTEYHYIISGDFLIIQNDNNQFVKENVPLEVNARDSVCLIDVNPSVAADLEISGYGASGSGFLCEVNGAKFLVTNIHVIAGANSLSDISVKTIDNIEVKLTNGFIAQDRDLCIFRHEEDSRFKYLKISKDISQSTKNDPIYLLGYPLGGGVLIKADGLLNGIGSTLIEIDCSAFRGNSGGPVITSGSNEVIGLLTKGELVRDDIFTKLAREKSGNPFNNDLRIFATRIDTVPSGSWAPLEWHIWKSHKLRISKHKNALLALNSLVSSNYKPGTLITDEDNLVRDKDLWRAYKKCANDYNAAISRNDYTSVNSSLKSFIAGVEISFRPISGGRWQELEEPWRYEWFVSPQSGNTGPFLRDHIQKLYRELHNDWQMMKNRWEIN
jgi:hypothetical protein